MKILYVSGKGYHAWAMHPLNQLRLLGHEVKVLCPNDPALCVELQKLGLEFQVIDVPRKLRDFGAILRTIYCMAQLYRAERPDVVYHYMIPISIWSRIGAWIAGVPVRVYKPVSLWELDIWFYRVVEFATAWMDDLVFATNRELERIYKAWPQTRAKTHLSYLAFPTDKFNPDDPSLPARMTSPVLRDLEIVESRRSVLLAGVVAHLYPPISALRSDIGVKGHEILIEAAPGVLDQCPMLKFVIVGDEPPGTQQPGRYKAKLEARVSELGLAEHFVFLGARSDIPAVLMALDFVVMPSLSEGLPLAAVEALLMERPVIASRVGGLPEVIIEGETGFLVPPGDAQALAKAVLRMVQLPPQERLEMGRRGRRLVLEWFDIRHVINREIAFYEEVLTSKRRTGFGG